MKDLMEDLKFDENIGLLGMHKKGLHYVDLKHIMPSVKLDQK